MGADETEEYGFNKFAQTAYTKAVKHMRAQNANSSTLFCWNAEAEGEYRVGSY